MKRKSLIIALSILGASAVLFSGLNKVNKLNHEPLVVLAENDPQDIENLRIYYKELLHNLVDENDYSGDALDELRRIIAFGEDEIDKTEDESEMEHIVEMVNDYINYFVNEMQREQDERTDEEDLEEARKDAHNKAIIETGNLGQYHTAYQDYVDEFLMSILDRIDGANSIDEINQILSEMYTELASIPNQERERLEGVLKRYTEALAKYLRDNKTCYTEDQYKKFKKIVDDACNRIWACQSEQQAYAIYSQTLEEIRVENASLGLNIDTSHLLDEPTEDPIDKKNGWLIATIIEGSVLVIALAGISIILIRRRKNSAK